MSFTGVSFARLSAALLAIVGIGGSRARRPLPVRLRRLSLAFALSCATLPAFGCGGSDDAVAPAASTISVIELSQRTLTLGVGSSAPLEVTVRDAAGKTLPTAGVFWSSSDATVATVSSNGVVTALAVGTAKIAATLQGKSAVAALTVAPTPAAAVRLSPSELQLTVGQQGDLNATVVDAKGAALSGRVIAWESSNASVAIVDSTGHVTAVAPGAASVTASSEGKSTTAAVTVRAIAVASVKLTPTSVSLVEGQSTQLTAEAHDASGQVLSGRTITWNSNAPSVATVSSAGQVIAIAAGSATITATSEGRTATTAVSVAKRPVSSLVVSPSQLSLIPGQGTKLSVLVTDENGAVLSGRAVSFTSASAEIATVSTNGTVTAVAAGSTTITVTSEGKTATVPVTVTPTPAASVRVAPATVNVIVGATTQLTATVLDAGGEALDRAVSWSSGAPTVASVADDGTVTGVGVGTAVILASAEGRVGSATVTVAAIPVATVTIAPSSSTLDPGASTTLVARVQSATGANLPDRAVLWSSSDTEIATVSSAGVVTAVAPGSATITASADGKTGTATISVNNPATSVRITPSTASVVLGATTKLTATVLDASGGTLKRPVTWSSGAPTVASVSQDGTVTALGIGTAIISATAEGRVGSATVTVTAVPVGSVVVTPSSGTLDPGGSITLSASVRSATGDELTGRAVIWSSSDTRIATVSSAGVVMAVAPGAVTITASAEGKTGTATISVSNPATSIRVSPATASVPVGETTKLSATVLDAAGGTLDRPVSWSSSAPAVASVSPDGTVTATGIGTAIISASAEGHVGSATVTVTAEPVATVTISPASSTLDPGGTTTLTASVQSASGTVLTDRTVTWSSSDTKVATVSTSGVVTAIEAGEATITASAEGKSGSASITVSKPAGASVGRVTVTPLVAAIVWTGPRNRTVQLTATAYTTATGSTVDPNATFTWTTSNANVATVSPTGLVTAIADGIVTITVRSGTAFGTAIITSRKR